MARKLAETVRVMAKRIPRKTSDWVPISVIRCQPDQGSGNGGSIWVLRSGRAVSGAFGCRRSACRRRSSTCSSKRTAKKCFWRRHSGCRTPALAVPNKRALAIQNEVGILQLVRTGPLKLTTHDATPADQLDHSVRQLVSKAIASDRVIDVFAAAGISRPDVSILSDEFLAEVQEMPHRNVALALLEQLLSDEIATRKNGILSRRGASPRCWPRWCGSATRGRSRRRR